MKELGVFLCDRRAGTLYLKDNGNMQFRYEASYDGPPVSQCLPIQTQAYPHKLCHAVFGGLLVEGEAREVVARNLGVSTGNDYALLQAMGGDCAGAITLLPPGIELTKTPKTRRVDSKQFDDLLLGLPQRPLGLDPQEGIRLSLAGSQPKLPVIFDRGELSLPLNPGAPTTHIVKPEPSRFEGLVDNEAFCMDLAHAVELPTAEVTKHTTVSGLSYLMVKRYDRDFSSEAIHRLHQEDMCQAFGCPSERKYQAEGGPSITDIVSLLRKSSTQPAEDLPTLWRSLVFNWLIGNCDAHAKNYSILYRAKTPSLAPLYDLVCTTIYPELTTQLAMNINGARYINEVSDRAWVKLAQVAGYSAHFAQNETNAMVEQVVHEANTLATVPQHNNETVAKILASILYRAGCTAR